MYATHVESVGKPKSETFVIKLLKAITALTIFLGCAIVTAPEAQPLTVNKVVVAQPRPYSGRCPATIEFVGTIFVSRPARVDYRWERSDGVAGPRESVDIRSAAKSVTTRWQIGVSRKPFSGWQRLRVLAPNSVSSNTATIQLKCP